MIFLPEKLEINSINLDKNEKIPKKVIQANLTDFYYIKLYKTILSYSLIKSINTYHLLNLSINTRDCIYQFNLF